MPFGQFVPTIIGASQITGGGSSLFADATLATASPAHPYLHTPALATVDADMSAWLGVPSESAREEHFIAAGRAPTSLRIWTIGGDSAAAAFVLPTYSLGILRPATYTPNTGVNGPSGTYAPSTPDIAWLTPATNDNHNAGNWTTLRETVLTITPITAGLITTTFGRGQLVIYATLPSSTAGASLAIYGCGWR